ncbi:magnesium chelatase domain-containing protein [Actinomadura sp. NPDC048955]|uniref:magnesium chelatase domain-containing protein n=1 Tax=Actinomadura sp. NPDC048955 TaxID=3158228 RepID=UPI0033C2998D
MLGQDAVVVDVEAVAHAGEPALNLQGLPRQAESACRDRVYAATCNSGLVWPTLRITVTLHPVSLARDTSTLDLAVAGSVLAAAGLLPAVELDTALSLAELGLSGAVRPVRNALPMVQAAADCGASTVIVAPENAAEAAQMNGARVLAPRTLGELVEQLRSIPH